MAMSDHALRPLGGKLFTFSIKVLAPLVIICFLLVGKRLVMGIGDVSDLNGGYPWGIWIAFDLLIGTGFACGGWALAWAVYVFNRGEYHDLVRPRRCWRVCSVIPWAGCRSPSTWAATGICPTSLCRRISIPTRCCLKPPFV